MLCLSLVILTVILLTLDDVEPDAGRGGVVRSALVLSPVLGPHGLQQQGHRGHLGLVHHQAHPTLVGGHLGRERFVFSKLVNEPLSQLTRTF